MRKSWDSKWLEIAASIAEMSTCTRRDVGCVVVDENNHLAAIGCNGVAPGQPHCRSDRVNEPVDLAVTCLGASALSGTGLDSCAATHAEQNALLRCANIFSLAACFTTVSPCVSCTKLLLSTSIRRIVFLEEYAQPAAKILWEASVYTQRSTGRRFQRTWEKYVL